MIFRPTTIEGAYIVEPERSTDERGFFARTWSDDEFRDRGLADRPVQMSISFNGVRGTLRGMHWQASPDDEAKLVRCTSGEIYDVLADVRPESPTFGVWESFELSATNRLQLYVPPVVAHGFQTLEHETEVAYVMSGRHAPGSARGFSWDDPLFGIEWPAVERRIMNDRDRNWPRLELRVPPRPAQ